MSDIFLSYAREDLNRARQLAEALQRKGWDVSWDRTIPTGTNWRIFIGDKLEKANCVVVVWSKASVGSNYVIEEAESGLERNTLFPVLLEPVRLPLGFRQVHSEDLSAWDGSENFPAFQKLVRDLETLLGPARTTAPDKGQRRSDKSAASTSRPSLVAGTVFQDTLKNGSQGPEIVVVPAGEFKMGDVQGNGADAERPIHIVRIQKPFAMGKYPVTFEEYDKYVSATGLKFPEDEGWGRNRQPAINVSWLDAVKFSEWLSKETGKHYRLPTEAEWEYAARAGTVTTYWWGNEIKPDIANFRGGDNRWGGKQTSPVGSFGPNPFGLCDTAGNVWEWMQDSWHENYIGAPSDGSAWESSDIGQRVLRGGSWDNRPGALRSSNRDGYGADFRSFDVGFRLAQDLN